MTIYTTPIPDEGNDLAAAIQPEDGYFRSLMAVEAAAVPLSPDEKKDARSLIAKFLKDSEDHRGLITYTQHRPFQPRVYPKQGYRGDCSSYPTQAFFYAWDILDGPPLHDPNGRVEYDGYGWTGTLLSTNHQHSVPLDRKFFVGDIAIFGPNLQNTRHATVCRKNGVEADAIFSSHGGQVGPLPTRLRYRNDLLCVLRPVSLL